FPSQSLQARREPSLDMAAIESTAPGVLQRGWQHLGRDPDGGRCGLGAAGQPGADRPLAFTVCVALGGIEDVDTKRKCFVERRERLLPIESAPDQALQATDAAEVAAAKLHRGYFDTGRTKCP